jgi:hypothetical protein
MAIIVGGIIGWINDILFLMYDFIKKSYNFLLKGVWWFLSLKLEINAKTTKIFVLVCESHQ